MLNNAWRAEWLLLRRLFLGRRVLPTLAIPLVIGLVFTAVYWVANAFAVSGTQVAERDLGRFEHGVTLPVEPGDLSASSLAEVRRKLLASDVDDVSMEIGSGDLRPDQVELASASGPTRVTWFAQPMFPSANSPDVYRLASGRWPSAPGEVLVSPALQKRLDGDKFTAFAGSVTFHVVGAVVDRFDTESISMVAAPQTWESIPSSTAEAFAPVASLRILWSGPTSAASVESIARGVLVLAPPEDGSQPAIDRAVLIKQRETSLSEDQKLLFAYPLSLLSAMVGVSVAQANRRWTQAYLRRGREVGLAPLRIGWVLTTVVTAGVALAVTAGMAAGALAGWTLRSWVLPHFLTHPAGPAQSLAPVVIAALVMTLVALIASAADVLLPTGVRRKLTATARHVPWSLGRRVLAAVAVAKGIQAANRSSIKFDDLGGTGVLLTAAAVLLAPDLLALSRRCLSERRARPLVARRMLDADRGGLALVSMIVAASVAFPTTVSSYNATARHSNDMAFVSTVRPHQLWVDGDFESADEIANVVEEALPDTRAIRLLWTDAFVYPHGGSPSENTGIVAVENADDLHALLTGEPWTEKMVDFVSSGGIAFVEGPVREVHNRADDSAGTINLPARLYEPELEGVAVPFAGLLLSDTAKSINLGSVPMSTVFTDLDQAEINTAISAVRRNGLDTRALSFHTPPPHTPPTPQSYFALGGLLVLASFLLLGLMRAAGERMRERAAQLLAIGFPRRWSASAAALQVGLAVVAGLIMGAAGSAAALFVFIAAPGQTMVLSVPVGFVSLTVGLVLVIGALGIAVCLARVRPLAGDTL